MTFSRFGAAAFQMQELIRMFVYGQIRWCELKFHNSATDGEVENRQIESALRVVALPELKH